MSVVAWILANYQTVIVDTNAVVLALIALFTVIPGEQPEKFLHGVAEFLGKFSNK